MKTYLKTTTDSPVNNRFNLRVYYSEKRKGRFIICPVGAIHTLTFQTLKNEIARILESKPEMIVFDMKQVDYINSKGLHVILDTIVEMYTRSGNVYLTNLQPQIEHIFDVMKGALPLWFKALGTAAVSNSVKRSTPWLSVLPATDFRGRSNSTSVQAQTRVY